MISNSFGIIAGAIISVGSLGWTFFKKSFQKALPFISKWLCKKFFPANPEGLIIQWRIPRAGMDRKTTSPQIDCYVTIHNFCGYSIRIDTINLWIGSLISRDKHNIDVSSSKKEEIHFQGSLTDGEYRAILQTAQYKRNGFSNISEINVGIRVIAKTSIGTDLNVVSARDIGYVLIEEYN
jgi:hypothetical protein